MSKLLGKRDCSLRYNNRLIDELKVEEKDVVRKHEEELENWADKFFAVQSEKGEDSRTCWSAMFLELRKQLNESVNQVISGRHIIYAFVHKYWWCVEDGCGKEKFGKKCSGI
jgi:hypothetical protein